jgi:hypothetical protein
MLKESEESLKIFRSSRAAEVGEQVLNDLKGGNMPDKTKMCVICRGILGETLQEDEQFAKEEEFMDDVHICVVCARKERVQKLVKEYKPFMEKFSHLVNNCAFDHDGLLTDAIVSLFFSEHRYLQNEMLMGLLKILTKIGKESGNVMYEDARNRWGLKWCKEVSELDVFLDPKVV